ncbi:unnamed protein product [Effrenium voratum]|uniref:Uncharacterized protein n=1 Tax=Effrenium voratum TaxID=2562239 RepID=A0AA36N2G0_9DINO|nr:unnamed protein product [Effrenium voratum]
MNWMCALHPELFESLLSGDLTAHAESIAVGLSRHLACEVSALRLAAAELAEDFAAFFEGAVEGWMRKAHLAQWLVEACRRGEDLGARAAACRALGRLDEPRLQTAAADALMDACSFALSVTAPVGEKRQVLQMAAESLSRCPGSGAFAPQQLVAILRAAVDTEGDLLEDCLEPVYFCVTHRPMDSEMSISCLAELLDATTALARQDLMQDFMSETLGQIMVMLSDIVWSRARSLCAESRHDGRLQGLPELDLLIRAAELLGRGSLRKAELVRALAAALWPALELGASFSEEQAAAFIKCCLQLDYLVPKLMDNEVLLAEDGPEGAAEELAAGQLMAVLLIPFLSVDAVSLQPLVPPSELQRLCSALLRSEDAWLARAAAAAAAETDLEEAELDRLAMGLPPLPLRAVVLLTCAVGRCAQKAAGFVCGFAGEKLALAWGPLLAETRRSMAEPNAQEEWRLLKNLLPNGRNQLITALGWLLASAEEAEDAKDILLRAIELECASPEMEDWRWLSNCLPSPLWMAQRLEDGFSWATP